MKKVVIIGCDVRGGLSSATTTVFNSDIEETKCHWSDEMVERGIEITSDGDEQIISEPYLINNKNIQLPYIPMVKHLPKGHERPYRFHR